MGLRERGDQRSRSCVVAERLADVRVAVYVARRKDATPAKLKRILAQLVLFMARFARSFARLSIVLAEQMKNAARFQLRGAVCLTLLVDQQRKGNACFLTKLARIHRVAKPNRRERCSLIAKRFLVGAQLRDVFPAENSSIVPQKNNHRRLFVPQGTKPDLVPFAVRQRNKGKPVAESVFHRHHLVQREQKLSRRL